MQTDFELLLLRAAFDVFLRRKAMREPTDAPAKLTLETEVHVLAVALGVAVATDTNEDGFPMSMT